MTFIIKRETIKAFNRMKTKYWLQRKKYYWYYYRTFLCIWRGPELHAVHSFCFSNIYCMECIHLIESWLIGKCQHKMSSTFSKPLFLWVISLTEVIQKNGIRGGGRGGKSQKTPHNRKKKAPNLPSLLFSSVIEK